MNKTLLPLFLAFIALSCNAGENMAMNALSFNKVKGSKPVNERTVVHAIDEIQVSQSIDAEVIAADEERVEISAPADLQEFILAEFSGNSLHLKVKPNSNVELRDVRVKIFVKEFTKITANTSADVEIKETFTQDRVAVAVSTSATLKGHLEANEFSIDASTSGSYEGKVWAVNLRAKSSSSANINLSGKAKNAFLGASSSSTIDADKMMIENLTAEASSSASVSASASNSVTGTASSSSSINVRKTGPLEIRNISENSSGRVLVQ